MQKNNYRQLGKTGMKIFPLGFGGIPIRRLTKERAVKVIKMALISGINFFDTSSAYGDSEEKIGAALEKYNNKQNVYLATKTKANNKEDAIIDINQSLEKLKTDKIHLYQLHNVSNKVRYKKVMSKGGALEGLKQAKKEGKIKHIGITSHSLMILEKAIETGEFETIMFAYNFIENDCEKRIIDRCSKKNIGMLAMKPLAGGRIRKVKLALKYVLRKSNIVPLVGIETTDELLENISVVNENSKLTKSEIKILKEYKNKFDSVFCRRCDYCQPCPQEISISLILRAKSIINRFPINSINENSYIYKSFSKALECKECGICEKKCPYDLPIRRLLKINLKIMDNYYKSHNIKSFNK